MVRRKIIWSHRARIRLLQILEFYNERNRSKVFSIKLYNEFKEQLTLITKQPEIGIKTEIIGVRGLIFRNFILFYEIKSEQIIIHSIWDCRQNPEDLIIVDP